MKHFFWAVILTTFVLAGCQSEQQTPLPVGTVVSTNAPTNAPARVPPDTMTPLPASPLVVTRPLQPTATPESPTVTPPPISKNDIWVVARLGLNLRAAASVTADVILVLESRQHLTALENKIGPDADTYTWQNVRTDEGKVGWVATEDKDGEPNLTTTDPNVTPTPTTLPAAPSTNEPPNYFYVSAPEGLNFREQPDRSSKIIAILARGQRVLLLSAKNDASGIVWNNVRTDEGQTGWSSAEFLSPTNPIAATPVVTPLITTTPAVTLTTAVSVTTSDVWINAAEGLNLRVQSNVTATLIAVLKFGQHLTALGAGVDVGGIAWQNVRTNDGRTGWVAALYLSVTPPALTSTAVGGVSPTVTPMPTITPTRTATP